MLEPVSASLSFDSTPVPAVFVAVASSSTAFVSLLALGASFIPKIVKVMVAVSVPPLPSLTVYVKTSVAVVSFAIEFALFAL